ncbi:MarR family winged helix-turn-helix transcriptional regulator [Lactobacillus hamsteri]|nr:MarR family winged helix-turn-helix transcriptional regulator [Lactobacillus hamsteri]
MNILSFSTIAEYIKKEINHKCGLNISQTRILLFFDKSHNQPLTMGKLAKGLNISLSTLSRQLQQKKTRLLIEVTKSSTDSSKTVALNTSGLSKVNDLKKTLNSIQQKLFSNIAEDEINIFVTNLNLLANQSNYAQTSN